MRTPAFAYVEAHLSPYGPVCYHCGNADGKRIRKMAGKTTRRGLYKCYECGKPFTVRMGTIFESSQLPLHLWLQIIRAENIDADAIIPVDYQNDGAIRIDETRVKLKRVVATGIALKLSCAA
jgi:Transposase zinc-ribbon domain